MRYLSYSKTKYIILAILGSITLIGSIAFGVFYLEREVSLQEKKLEGLKEHCRQMEDFQNAHGNGREFFKDMEASYIQVDKLLPGKKDMGALLERVQRAGKKAGVMIKEMTPGEEEEFFNGSCRGIPVELKIEGNFFSLLDMLKYLSEGGGYIGIKGINVTGKENLQCKMTIYSFYETH